MVGRTTPSYCDLISSQHLSGGRCFITSHAATVSLDVYSRGAKGDMTQKKNDGKLLQWQEGTSMVKDSMKGPKHGCFWKWCHKSSICWWTCDRTDQEMDISIVKRCCEGCGSVMLKGKHPERLTAGTYKSHLNTMDRVQSSNIILWKSICITPTTGLVPRLFLFQRDTPEGCGKAFPEIHRRILKNTNPWNIH